MKPALWQAHCAEERAERSWCSLHCFHYPVRRLDCAAAALSTRSHCNTAPERAMAKTLCWHEHQTVNLCSLLWGIICVCVVLFLVVFFNLSWRCDIAAMMCYQTPRSLRRGDWGFAPLLAAALLSLLVAGMQQATAFPSWRLEVCCDHCMTCSSCHRSSSSY